MNKFREEYIENITTLLETIEPVDLKEIFNTIDNKEQYL